MSISTRWHNVLCLTGHRQPQPHPCGVGALPGVLRAGSQQAEAAAEPPCPHLMLPEPQGRFHTALGLQAVAGRVVNTQQLLPWTPPQPSAVQFSVLYYFNRDRQAKLKKKKKAFSNDTIQADSIHIMGKSNF